MRRLAFGSEPKLSQKCATISRTISRTEGYESPDFDPGQPLRAERSDVVAIAKRCIGRQYWKKRIKKKTYKNEAEAHVGGVATTFKTVTSRESLTFQRITQYCGDDVLALEQEGFGFLWAAKLEDTCAIIIRGIPDFGEHKEKAEKAGSKKCAITNASAFTFELLVKISYSNE
jgi:nucleoside phosphorylase